MDNLVSFFKMLNYITTGGLQRYVADQGFADSLLYFGAKTTSEVVPATVCNTPSSSEESGCLLNRARTPIGVPSWLAFN